ncbi:hypothetical protein [Nannocystis punicea]|uniref:Uncharacterized protein n=1 Tax=Nannocystis punicea TaxID=2995304 RepID=A0ABY7GXA8_9BACT|nr:hypothetical protein [Nannocystis poenicansa]WAS91620.1 hypothetical protein O0S08_36020 [Nannocystis poenicansa]
MTLQRLRNAVLFAAAVLLGAAAPLGLGCNEPCPEEPPEGLYTVERGPADWKAGARIEVTATRMIVSYATSDGNEWEAEYIRVRDPY